MDEFTDKLAKKLAQMIEIKGFYITEPGDPSVGIFPSTWVLEGKLIFDNDEELQQFKSELKQVFDNYCGSVKINTIDEIEKIEEDYTKHIEE